MNPLFLDCEQQSKAWFDARIGCVTSSRIADVVAKRKAKPKDGTAPEPLQCTVNMRWELALELLINKPSDHYVSRWMEEGKEKEPFARIEYEERNHVFVEQVGFAYHPQVKLAGASPDGIIGDKGLLEIKCPKIETHIQYLIEDKIPDEYLPQMVWQLGCCPDFEWNDFVSFYCPLPDTDPRFAIELPDDLRIFQKRLHRTKELDNLLGAYEREVEGFNESVQELLASIKARVMEAVA